MRCRRSLTSRSSSFDMTVHENLRRLGSRHLTMIKNRAASHCSVCSSDEWHGRTGNPDYCNDRSRLLHFAKFSKYLSAEAAMTAIYIKNRLPSPKYQDQAPFEIINRFRPSVKHMRLCGCHALVLTLMEKRSKWDTNARKGLFMGYEEVSKAYRIYDIEADQVVISPDVNFDKSSFTFLPMLLQDVVVTPCY